MVSAFDRFLNWVEGRTPDDAQEETRPTEAVQQKDVRTTVSDLSFRTYSRTNHCLNDVQLSPDELSQYLLKLYKRFQTGNPCRPEGISFEDVKKMIWADPLLACRLFNAEEALGAEMDIIQAEPIPVFYDFRPELLLKSQTSFLQNSKGSLYNEAIAILEGIYPNFGIRLGNRTVNHTSGPNIYEAILIKYLFGLEFMDLNDYKDIQNKLPENMKLDIRNLSWFSPTQDQLNRACAPAACWSRDKVGECEAHVDAPEIGFRPKVSGTDLRKT